MMGDRWTPEEVRKRMDDAAAEVDREFHAAGLLPAGMHVEWEHVEWDFGPLLGVVDGDRPAFTDDEDERR